MCAMWPQKSIEILPNDIFQLFPSPLFTYYQNFPPSYLIFGMNAVNGVRVNFLAECKKIPEEQENYRFGIRL